MKKILRFLFGLFINVCILFILVKAFSYSYDFAYQVFATRAADPGSNRKATIQITQDEPLLDVADSLKTAEVIKDKYAFILKVRYPAWYISDSTERYKSGDNRDHNGKWQEFLGG